MNRVVILLILLARCMGDASLANGRVSLESLLFSGLQSPNGSETAKPSPITPTTTDQTHGNNDNTVPSTSTSVTTLSEPAHTDSENPTEISTSGSTTSSQPTTSSVVTDKTLETPDETNSVTATTASTSSGAGVPGGSISPDDTKERDRARGSESRGPERSSEHSSVSQEGENSSGPGVLPQANSPASGDEDGVVRAGDDGMSAGGRGGSDNAPSVGGGTGDNGGSDAVDNENKGIGSNDETGTKTNTQTTDKGSNIQRSFQIWYMAVTFVILFQEMRRP